MTTPSKGLQWSPYSVDIFTALRSKSSENRHLIINAVAGSGKCLGVDTPVLMHNGNIKQVQDIQVGDLLMGPDSQPRKVLSVNQGEGLLFRIKPVKGDSWVCNDVHVLTLRHSVTKEIFDVPLNEFLLSRNNRRHYNAKLFRVAVDFPVKPLAVEPYLLGLWLGDGAIAGPRISVPDQKIIDYLIEIAPKYGLTAKVTYPKGKCPNIDLTGLAGPSFNFLRNEFIKCVKNNSKFIPSEYLINSRENRLQLLAGLIDTDGYEAGGYYEIITKFDSLRDNILFLARSLGFAAYCTKKTGTIKSSNFSGDYWRITISGHVNSIPCKIIRKQAQPRLQKKDVTNTGFTATSIGEGKYYGFTLDLDGRFLLSDFTVTHNTTNLVEMANIIETEKMGSYAFYAFNVDIIKALKERLANPEAARTLHSLGANMLWQHLGFYPQMDKFKYRNMVEASLKDMYFNDAESLNTAIRDIRDIIGKAMAELVYAKSETFYDELDAVVDHFGLDIPASMQKQDVYNLVRDILVRGEKIAKVNAKKFGSAQNGIEFDDMIYLPNLWDLRCPISSTHPKVVTATDFVLGDEIQDMSKGKIHLALRSMKPNGRFVGCGDISQSIYGFSGSDSNSIPNIVSMLDAKVLPLSISYRCPKSVIAEAQKIVPHIESAPNAPEGEVRTILDTQLLNDGMLPPGALILSRKTNPLIKLCISLLKNRIPAKVKGRDIGKQLLTVAKEIVGKNGNFQNFDTKCEAYIAKRAEVMSEWKDKESRLESMLDRIEAVKAIVESYATPNLAALSAAIDELFSDGGSVITLSTVHRAKGLEYDDVFIIQPEALPLGWKNQKPWEKQQEMNLKYVAITRAKQRLTWVTTTEKAA